MKSKPFCKKMISFNSLFEILEEEEYYLENLIEIPFNSLFEILFLYPLSAKGNALAFNSLFEIPSWAFLSLRYIVTLSFQFSFWDSCESSSIDWSQESANLSILFLRFNLLIYSADGRQKMSPFNSLFEIRGFRRVKRAGRPIASFNSLFEIRGSKPSRTRARG